MRDKPRRQVAGRWLRSLHASASTRDLMAIMSRVTWGCEPDEVSMLHAVRYVKAAGGIGRMLDVEGGAQQDRFPGGTQQIALRMADELGERVRLNAIVRRIERHADGTITVGSDGGDVTAKAVIVAIPPAHRAAIDFSPDLPAEYEKLAQHWPQGNLSKAYAAYETPFWRANGCCGEALSDEGPVFITFDVSPDDDGPGILLGFTDPRTFDPLPPAERRERALAGFAALFGDEALQPIDYVDHCWGTEDFAPGGPTAAVPPGFVDHLRAVATQARRGHLLGGHRNRRRVDRLPRRRRAVGPSRGRRGARAELVRLGRAARCGSLTDSTSQRSCPLTSSGRSRIAQCPPDSSTNCARLGAILAMWRDETIGSSRSFSLPITSVGTVRFCSPMCWCVPSESTSVRAQPPRPAGGVCGEQLVDELGDLRIRVAAHRHHRHEPPAGPVHRAQQRRRPEGLQQGPRRRAPWRRPSRGGTGTNLTWRSRSPVVVLIRATASARSVTRRG